MLLGCGGGWRGGAAGPAARRPQRHARPAAAAPQSAPCPARLRPARPAPAPRLRPANAGGNGSSSHEPGVVLGAPAAGEEPAAGEQQHGGERLRSDNGGDGGGGRVTGGGGRSAEAGREQQPAAGAGPAAPRLPPPPQGGWAVPRLGRARPERGAGGGGGPLAGSGGVSGGSVARKRPAAAAAVRSVTAPGQPLRQRDKLVLLPGDAGTFPGPAGGAAGGGGGSGSFGAGDGSGERAYYEPTGLAEADAGSRGRVTLYCISESLQRQDLEALLRHHYPDCQQDSHPDVLHVELPPAPGSCWGRDLFFFDYGVVAAWGLTEEGERAVAALARRCAVEAYAPDEVEVDEFKYVYSVNEPPSMNNDVVTISRPQAADHQVKLAISLALAQSTRLSVYEEKVLGLVLRTKHLPRVMAAQGVVNISSKEVAQLIGQVFLQRSAVNLLTSVLDTPEFFWSAPDSMQVLYERACEYLELEERLEVLNARFEVLSDMLDMLRDYTSHQHSAHLEWIIIYLIAVELVLGLIEVAALFGLIGNGGAHLSVG